jgi:hypothetical protein
VHARYYFRHLDLVVFRSVSVLSVSRMESGQASAISDMAEALKTLTVSQATLDHRFSLMEYVGKVPYLGGLIATKSLNHIQT